MAKQDPKVLMAFGYGGRQYFAYPHTSFVTLPDGRVVRLGQFQSNFPSTGPLSIPAQPLRVDEAYGMRQAPLAELNTTGKNFLVDRLAFTAACGCKFRVSPEIYGDALDLSGEFHPVLIRLPIPRADTFYKVSEWSPPGTPLAIVNIELTHDIYQLDAEGERILVKVETGEKDEHGNPIKAEKPILRPHVWATSSA